MVRLFKILLVFLVGITLFSFFYFNISIQYLEQYVVDSSLTSALIFIGLMFVATIVAPLTALPLVPLSTILFGPFTTAVYVIIGWWFGALVAFLIARFGGRPLLMKFISLKRMAQYETTTLKDVTFWGLIFLRMIIPVDILSYAVGLLSTISFSAYAIATLIGIIPFALLFSYGGATLFHAEYTKFVVVALGASLLFISVLYFLYKKRRTIVVKDSRHYDTADGKK